MRRGYAFGLDLAVPFAIPRLPPGPPVPGAPRTELVSASASEVDRAGRGGEVVLLRSFDDGRPMMVVEQSGAGYRVWAPRFGHHFVSSDGRRVLCALPRIAAWRWERLLFAQVLPLASALQGLELFHASGVVLDGRAIAFVGLSGTGKSSTAAHLVARGHPFLTDDVLALEAADGELLAHPGTSLVGLDPRELARMDAGAGPRRGGVVGRSDKTYVTVEPVSRPVPLGGLYFLEAGGTGRSARIDPVEESAELLLGSSFLTYLASPLHLLHHLDVCAGIAESVPTFSVVVPPAVDAVGTAAAIEAHALGLAAGARR